MWLGKCKLIRFWVKCWQSCVTKCDQVENKVDLAISNGLSPCHPSWTCQDASKERPSGGKWEVTNLWKVSRVYDCMHKDWIICTAKTCVLPAALREHSKREAKKCGRRNGFGHCGIIWEVGVTHQRVIHQQVWEMLQHSKTYANIPQHSLYCRKIPEHSKKYSAHCKNWILHSKPLGAAIIFSTLSWDTWSC